MWSNAEIQLDRRRPTAEPNGIDQHTTVRDRHDDNSIHDIDNGHGGPRYGVCHVYNRYDVCHDDGSSPYDIR
jgi:hypothetical protein